jgi:hypothetical protein
MSEIGFEPTTPVFVRAKTVHALGLRPHGHYDRLVNDLITLNYLIMSMYVRISQIGNKELYIFNFLTAIFVVSISNLRVIEQ